MSVLDFQSYKTMIKKKQHLLKRCKDAMLAVDIAISALDKVSNLYPNVQDIQHNLEDLFNKLDVINGEVVNSLERFSTKK